MYEDLAKDRLLETENLTDALDSEAGDWLLNWGISQIPRMLNDVTDEAAANEKISGLMRVMRTLNGLGADAPERPAEELSEAIQAFLEGHQGIVSVGKPFAAAPIMNTVDGGFEGNNEGKSASGLASAIAGKTPLEALKLITAIVTPNEAPPPSEVPVPAQAESDPAAPFAAMNLIAQAIQATMPPADSVTSPVETSDAESPSSRRAQGDSGKVSEGWGKPPKDD
ncbi:MAG TPA: hypothetical protein PLD47_05685 [Aggregatilineales bacterium]|nr:hypothetical protein [Anaerolineales bacterium]HRE47198.1 hypothetical protein [Aggregatilineales bacterium]